jgi:hypothetical protein
MNKRRLHHVWKRFRVIKPAYLLALTLISAAVCVFALRANNEHMVQLRSEVYAADQANGDVEGALLKLQAYVTSHMNTDLSAGPNAVYPPIQLKYTYDRLVQAQGTQISENNSALYTEAQAYCQKIDPVDFSGHNRVPCIEQYVEAHGETIYPIPANLYEFDFLSPRWSPDLAGWSLVVSVLCGLLFLVVVIARKVAKNYLS